MRFRLFWLVIPLLLLAIEGEVWAWRHAGLEPSKALVFHWKGAELLTTAPRPFGLALEIYRADRGAESVLGLADGRKMTIFYFEWDRIEFGPFIDIGGHEAEVCNVQYGSFKLLKRGGQRIYRFANGETMNFDYTLLKGPDGSAVYVYKCPWIQGIGKWINAANVDRFARLRRTMVRHLSEARVLEAGIFGAASEDEAWCLFEREVLEKLEWSGVEMR